MEKKPITTFLKVMAIVHLVIGVMSVIGNLLSIVAYTLLPGLSDLVREDNPGLEITPLTWISIVFGVICAAVDVYLSVLALKHQKLQLVYRVSILTMLVVEVFNGVSVSGIGDVISLLIGLILPILFIYAVYQQIKLDGEKP